MSQLSVAGEETHRALPALYRDVTEPPDRLTQLREQHTELLRAIGESDFGRNPPRWRDRNPFWNWLLNGGDDVLEQTRLPWQKYKRDIERAERLKTEIDFVIRERVTAEPGYRALAAKADKEGKARRVCRQLIDAIHAAREEITRADSASPEAARADVKRDMAAVSSRLHAVRRRAEDVANLPDGSGFRQSASAGAHLAYSRGDDHQKRSRKYSDVRAALDSLEKRVNSVLGGIARRESEIRSEQQKFMKDGIERYNRQSDGRG